jgi:hypothetical protein
LGSICAITKLPCPASEITGWTCSHDAGVDDVATCATKLIEMNLEMKNDIADLEDYIQFLKNEELAVDSVD